LRLLRPQLTQTESCRARHFLQILPILIAEKFSGECKSKKVTGFANLRQKSLTQISEGCCAFEIRDEA
jgi:hypothetical protein